MRNWERDAMVREFPWTSGLSLGAEVPRPKIQRVDESILCKVAVYPPWDRWYGTVDEVTIHLADGHRLPVSDGKTALEEIAGAKMPAIAGISLLSYYQESDGRESNHTLCLYLPKADVAALYERLTSAAARDLRAEAEHA